MIRGLLNVASSALFISLLGFAMWWSRRGERQWTSSDGMRCICQIRISGDGLEHPWREARLLIIPALSTIAITAKGHRGNPRQEAVRRVCPPRGDIGGHHPLARVHQRAR